MLKADKGGVLFVFLMFMKATTILVSVTCVGVLIYLMYIVGKYWKAAGIALDVVMFFMVSKIYQLIFLFGIILAEVPSNLGIAAPFFKVFQFLKHYFSRGMLQLYCAISLRLTPYTTESNTPEGTKAALLLNQVAAYTLMGVGAVAIILGLICLEDTIGQPDSRPHERANLVTGAQPFQPDPEDDVLKDHHTPFVGAGATA
eukprot:TRINITY_DN67882_c8_g1_i1.p1 TRINITY_DN67882_c8_g1~~TRINITY_DN67882_c8_g1_i1.p1  ORF type:complete len:201 (+),score=22.16 TRINITY_DN67882_c8_g1_i1:19-621(+)